MQTHADLNIQDFCHYSANILIFLLERFPQKQTLYIDDISDSAVDEFGMRSDSFFTAIASTQWLAEEQFIRYSQQVKQEAFDDVVLTAQGLRALFARTTATNLSLADALRAAKNEPTQQMLLVLEALKLI